MTTRATLRKQAQKLMGRDRDHQEFVIPAHDRALLLRVLRYGDTNINESKPATQDFLDPYVRYICTRLAQNLVDKSLPPGQSAELFAEVVGYFSRFPTNNVAAFVEDSKEKLEKIFPPNQADVSGWTKYRVANTVFCLSLWMSRESFSTSFADYDTKSKFLVKQKNEVTSTGPETLASLESGQFSVPEFAEVAGLRPTISQWVTVEQSVPDEWIRKSDLNAKALRRISGIEIQWTFDVAKHFEFSRIDKKLFLFCLPSRLVIDYELTEEGPEQALVTMGFSRQYADEVKNSYALFFGHEGKPIFEDQYAKEVPIPKDPYLADVCTAPTASSGSDRDQLWTKRDFQYLWPRIIMLDTYLRKTPADSFLKVAWRDRRDSYGWYTFVFALMVLILTFISTVFTGIQSVKTFYPSNPPSPHHPLGGGQVSTLTSMKEMTITVTQQPTSTTGLPSTPTISASSGGSGPSPRASSGLSGAAATGIGIGVTIGAILGLSLSLSLYFVLRGRWIMNTRRPSLAMSYEDRTSSQGRPLEKWPNTAPTQSTNRTFLPNSAGDRSRSNNSDGNAPTPGSVQPEASGALDEHRDTDTTTVAELNDRSTHESPSMV